MKHRVKRWRAYWKRYGFSKGLMIMALQPLINEAVKEIQEANYKDALEDMVWQFGYREVKNNQPIIYTGGLSALEGAFEALRWDDPHYLPDAEGYCCEIEGCVEHDTCGLGWGDLYLRLCSDHAKDCWVGKPLPKVKQWAIDREARRDPITKALPVQRR